MTANTALDDEYVPPPPIELTAQEEARLALDQAANTLCLKTGRFPDGTKLSEPTAEELETHEKRRIALARCTRTVVRADGWQAVGEAAVNERGDVIAQRMFGQKDWRWLVEV